MIERPGRNRLVFLVAFSSGKEKVTTLTARLGAPEDGGLGPQGVSHCGEGTGVPRDFTGASPATEERSVRLDTGTSRMKLSTGSIYRSSARDGP